MNRRRFITTAGIGGTSALLGIGLLGDRAAAESEMNFTAANPAVATGDGTISSVYIAPTGTIEWQDFDESIENIRVRFASKIEDGSFETVVDETFPLPKGSDARGQAGSFEYDDATDRITLYSGSAANRFEQDDDGAKKSTGVTVRVRIMLLNGTGEKADPAAKADLSATADFDIVVENEGATATVSGAANPGIET